MSWGWSGPPDPAAEAEPEPWPGPMPLEPEDRDRWTTPAPDDPITIVPEALPARRFALAACAVLLVLALLAGVAAVLSWRNGDRWRDLALVRGDRADQLDELLATSERDVTDLEGRISQLANEKAQAEDQREVAEGQSGVVAAAVDDAATVAAAADRCADAVERLQAAVEDGADVAELSGLAEEAVSLCAAARRAGADLVDVLGGAAD